MMKKLFTVIIGFVHDLATGCWAATVFAVWWLDRQDIGYDLLEPFVALKRQFFYIGLACIVVVLASGAGRSFTYVSNVYGKDSEKMRRILLVIKHIVLLTVFGLGTWWQYSMLIVT